jgi:potassium-transporting ATPase potassium-binding subunit
MDTWWLAAVEIGTLLLVPVLLYRPLGDYMAVVYTAKTDFRLERVFYRLVGVNPASGQTWSAYLRSVLAFSAISVLALYLIQRVQQLLPYSLGLDPVAPELAWNTAISFVTNTNWQSYSPEQTVGYTVQLIGLSVQNFLSAAVGMAVVIALIRGLASVKTKTLGNFWVDLTRGTVRILLPIAPLGAVVLLIGGVIQNFTGFNEVTTLTGATQTLPGGPVASQEAIKLLGTNGGGFFTANSAHPFENPNAWTNLVELALMLAIPFALPRTFGRMIGDNRQGYAIAATMGIVWIVSTGLVVWAEATAAGTVAQAAGATMEGKEARFGVIGSAVFGGNSTLTSTGAVNSMHDSFSPLGGGLLMVNMMLGEVAPGGAGSGLYGMLILAIIAVFMAGLMVGRTPEYVGKKIGAREMKLASLYILATPLIVLAGTGLSLALPGVRDSVIASMGNPGLHGYSELLYAFTSAGTNNGSAFAGLDSGTPWLAGSLGVGMLAGRFLPIVFVLALAGSFAAQGRVPETAGTLPTHRLQFIALLIGVVVFVAALTFLPALALGPLAEGIP